LLTISFFLSLHFFREIDKHVAEELDFLDDQRKPTPTPANTPKQQLRQPRQWSPIVKPPTTPTRNASKLSPTKAAPIVISDSDEDIEEEMPSKARQRPSPVKNRPSTTTSPTKKKTQTNTKTKTKSSPTVEEEEEENDDHLFDGVDFGSGQDEADDNQVLVADEYVGLTRYEDGLQVDNDDDEELSDDEEQQPQQQSQSQSDRESPVEESTSQDELSEVDDDEVVALKPAGKPKSKQASRKENYRARLRELFDLSPED